MIRSALAYASRGFAVLPLEPRGKRPLTRRGVYDATTEPWYLHHWWDRWPDANVGLAIRPDWLVIDVDVRSGGNDTIALWPSMPITPTQITSTGGLHFILKRPPGELKGKAAKGIDVLARGRFIVTAPSVRELGRYKWIRKLSSTPIAECPPWLVEIVSVKVTPSMPVGKDFTRSPQRVDNVTERARKYVAAIDGAVSGQGGHAQTFRVAQALVRGFSLDGETAYQLLAEYNERCAPRWSERELRHKIKSAAQRATMPDGALLIRS